MGMFKQVFIFSFLLVLGISLVAAISGQAFIDAGQVIPVPCSELDDFDGLACGQQISSADGRGAVDICENCYVCGVEDGICPEDFFSSINSMGVSCENCADPDCTGCVNGTVRVNDSGVLLPASGAEVYAYYPSFGGRRLLSTADSSGYFQANVMSYEVINVEVEYRDSNGEVYLSDLIPITTDRSFECAPIYSLYTPPASSPDDPDDPVDPPLPGDNDTVILDPSPCQADCTRGPGRTCDVSCEGVNDCSFASSADFPLEDVLDAVDGQMPGTRITLGQTVDCDAGAATSSYLYACEGAIQTDVTPVVGGQCSSQFSRIDNPIENLITRTQRVWFDGEPVEVVIVVWE